MDGRRCESQVHNPEKKDASWGWLLYRTGDINKTCGAKQPASQPES
jgi:hypothetical protein